MSIAELVNSSYKPWSNLNMNGMALWGKVPLSATATAQSLSASQSGYLVEIPQCTANVVLTLPAVRAGLMYPFRLTAVPDGTHTFTISSAEGTNISGHRIGVGAGLVSTSFSGVSNLILGATAANAKVGDRVDLRCDGTTWWAETLSSGTADAFSTS